MSDRVLRCPICQSPVVLRAGQVTCPDCQHQPTIPVDGDAVVAGVVFRWDMTPDERAALLNVLGDYLPRTGTIEVSVNAATGTETSTDALLARVLDLAPRSA